MQENEGKPPLTGLLYNGLLRYKKSLTEISWAGKGTNTPDVFTKWKLTFKNVDHHSLSAATFHCLFRFVLIWIMPLLGLILGNDFGTAG